MSVSALKNKLISLGGETLKIPSPVFGIFLPVVFCLFLRSDSGFDTRSMANHSFGIRCYTLISLIIIRHAVTLAQPF